MNQPYARVNQPYATLTLASALREMFGVQLYKNNARALLSRILSILNLDWLQHARNVRGVYEFTLRCIYYFWKRCQWFWDRVQNMLSFGKGCSTPLRCKVTSVIVSFCCSTPVVIAHQCRRLGQQWLWKSIKISLKHSKYRFTNDQIHTHRISFWCSPWPCPQV